MDVREAVETRFSCRAFLPTPVPEAIVRDILERAARAPSGGNLQPWQVVALAGEPLAAIKREIAGRPDELPFGEGAEYQIYPAGLRDPYEARRRAVGEALYQAIAVARSDRPARLRQYARNYQFFDAPVGLFFIIDRTMGPPQWSDFGGFLQTVMLLARAHGLDTCAQEAWTFWHKTLGRTLAIPDEHLLFCGMAMGYADRDAAINQWRSERAPLAGFARFAGFAEAPDAKPAIGHPD